MPAKKTPLEQLNDTLKKNNVNALVTTLGFEESLVSKVSHFLPTGILTLDVVLGGGWPIGRVVEVFGHEASGKSLLAALACAQAQKLGWLTVYMDTEFAVDQDFFRKLGIDLDKLFYISPDSIQDVFNVLEAMIEFKKQHYSQELPMIFVWDSVASTVTHEEKKRGWEDKGYSTAANYISQAFRKLRGEFGRHNILFFLINQIRTNIGVMYGDKFVTYGGMAPKFYSSIRLNLNEESMERVGEKGERKRVIGQKFRVEAVKNKIITPWRSCVLPLSLLTTQIDVAGSVLAMMKELKLATFGGGVYRANIPGLGSVSFGSRDIPELITTYESNVIELLNTGWKRVPAKKEADEGAEEGES